MKKLTLLVLLLCVLGGASVLADPPPAPDGWAMTASGKSFVYTPSDLLPGETYRVTVYPKASLGGQPLGDAMQRFCDKDVASLGAALGLPGKISVLPGSSVAIASGIWGFTAPSKTVPSKEARLAMYVALSADGKTVQVTRTVMTLKEGLMVRYQEGNNQITKPLIRALTPEAPPSETPADKPSAAQEEDAKKEAERYKYVTTPAKGVQDSQIECLALSYKPGFYDTMNNIDYSVTTHYLLLKDGTYHKDLPVAPCVLDVAVSRRKEPEAWGRWKRVGPKGDFLLTPPGKAGPFAPVKPYSLGTLYAVRPGELHGHFGHASSSGNMYTGGSVSQSGIAFLAGSRFETDSSYSFGNGSMGAAMGTVISGGGDENGSAVSASGGGAVVSSVQKKASAAGSRTGTYEVRGYNLVLHYDNGAVEYSPVFFQTKDRDCLSFRGQLCFSHL